MWSVIVPARNAGELTLNCIQSISSSFGARQEEIEYILIDDNSDEVHGIAGIFLNFRNSVKSDVNIFRFRTHRHYTGVFALGLSQAKGDYIFFISNDMMVTPDFLNVLAVVASKDDKIGIVRGTSQHTDSHPEHTCVPPLANP